MNTIEILVLEYANKQNYVYNNIAGSIRVWKNILRNPHFSSNIKYQTRCALIVQYRFLLLDIPIVKPIIEEYVLQNKKYCKTHKIDMLHTSRYDAIKRPITRNDIREMRIPILMAVFDKDFSE